MTERPMTPPRDNLSQYDLGEWKCVQVSEVDIDGGGGATVIDLECDGERVRLRVKVEGLGMSFSIEDPDDPDDPEVTVHNRTTPRVRPE